MAEEGQPVWDYAFFSAPTSYYMADRGGVMVQDNTRYAEVSLDVFGLPSNYLNVTDVDFYVPTDI